jgi:tRNA-specific 2-thiouridylase
MSGGVDSAVAAWLLREAGHQVLGLSLRLGQDEDQAALAGARSARELGIGHQVVEASRVFGEKVVAASARAYAQGLTPNPCAICNAAVKLPILWRAAQAAGCAGLATGHYARLRPGQEGPLLAEAADRAKSQAYFLARVEPELLAALVFPLAELTKPRVKELAAAHGLSAAERPESQDNCFLPPGGWDELVAVHAQIRGGPLEDEGGRVLGQHGGLHRFTVGQRRGLGVALGRPMYVLALDEGRAAVKLGPESSLWSRGLRGGEARWRRAPRDCSGLRVRVRYAHGAAPCRVETMGEDVTVYFHEPQRAVAPGQLAVFFDEDAVVGSAWIREALH